MVRNMGKLAGKDRGKDFRAMAVFNINLGTQHEQYKNDTGG